MKVRVAVPRSRVMVFDRRRATAVCVFAVVMAFFLVGAARSFAAENQVRFWIGKAYYEAGGQRYSMDVVPYVSGGRTYVPVRYLAYALSVPEEGVKWDDVSRTATLSKGGVTVRLRLESRLMELQQENAAPVTVVMDVAPEMRSGRVHLPARYVAAAMGYAVGWDPEHQAVTLEHQEVPLVKSLSLVPDPVEPSQGLSLKVLTSGPASSPVVKFKGVGGSGEPEEYWRRTQTLALRPGGPEEWVAGVVAPGKPGVYPVEVLLDGLTFTADNWLLKVYPEGFLVQPGYATPEEAVRARFGQDFKGCELRKLEPQLLLPDDNRDPRYHKLLLITYYQPFAGPILPPGTYTYCYYVLKDGPAGEWRVLQGGTGP